MRIAVLGGGLLGTATAANIARVQEIDSARGRSDEKHEISLFCAESVLGAHDFQTVQVDDISVEVGRYRTMPHIAGTYLSDLFSLANGENGHFTILGRRFRIPGETQVTRGALGAAALEKPWQVGTHGRLIRSFAVWDFETDSYGAIHKGWPLLDALHGLVSNEIWRAMFMAALMWSIKRCLIQESVFQRGQALVLVVIILAFVVLSPAGVVAIWQRTYSFWGSTIPMLFAHGLTAGISRGSMLGFVKAIAENNTRNRATCAPSLETLLRRTGLHMYMRGSGADYTEKFKYEADYVRKYIAPVVEGEYTGAQFSAVNSLACHFALLDADFSNSDVPSRIACVAAGNHTLCDALLEAARATTPVNVHYEAHVRAVTHEDDVYTLRLADGTTHQFDAVVLAECPQRDTLHLDSPRGDELTALLAYDTVEEKDGPATHIALVKGVANPAFFRFAREHHIPDAVCVTGSPHFSRVERVREASGEQDGIYVVYCSAKFESAGVFAEMFERGAEIAYRGKRAIDPYQRRPVPGDKVLDDLLPPVVLGKRFVYAAASYAIARHPEMDAMAAINAASLFSTAVNWESATNEEDEEEEGDDVGEVAETGSIENTDFPEDE